MTREQHLVFCKKCTNREMDLQQGLLCNLTGEKANFEDECQNYNLDDTVKVSECGEPLSHVDSMAQITEETLDKLRLEQNFQMALISGITVGLIGALLWGAITVATEYQIGYMAIAIGAGVGYSMRYFGKGIDPIFGISGGVIAVLSCVLGNFFSIIGFIANSEGLGYVETLTLFDYSQFIPIMTETFGVMDLLFYGFAAYEGYKFAFRVFTEQELLELE
jgi:hypothetical protein